jgi:2-polyprenyl-3-methyl-5-hydroxy-6-metoxy-1,4-benzoquinol methylase
MKKSILINKSTQKYWDDSWVNCDTPVSVNPADKSLNNYINRRFHHLFSKLFDKSKAHSMSLLEIGCAKSAWLPYFSKEFGFSVTGIDYSSTGCQLAENVLKINEVNAQVICANFFTPPDDMLGKFDVVVSFGVVEHFEDTFSCLRAISAFLKPGGILITSIPNMVGYIGAIQKLVNKPVFEIHKLLDPAQLRESHYKAKLDVIECDFFIYTNFGVNNLNGISTKTISGLLKKIFLGILTRASMVVWAIEDKISYFSSNKFTSPYINCIARKL